ncbi:D-alanyl-D-alanine carboxypeptidase/D-alanyl-D-alanine-endopeptidase [Cellulomonas sp. ES6]|uniref:D-alanyl-D-alanine carboxypeptidase/D-alanyl-D-alanine endopeptidase n=1 Tax=Cellulomonas sp. ES6 TaxID=3039384 RepID=UPI0024B7C9FF|nr:D-alanyl-D-alanine carboxypeptidase/D-alanyl-D-alanine-endopeptidase [Cellulomonas sp. ES6]WHP19115.1 D-alanyl-D-alanine carboxypeptidase/D-alanyl-D-alanine-endopeptidase [Cellulomonas sp. ES6]
MARAGRTVGTAALVVLIAGGAYATADAYDVVPGVVTLAPEVAPAAPFPTAPAAGAPATGAQVLADLDAAAPLPESATVQGMLDGLASDPRLGPSVGAVVADALTGEVLAEHRPGGARTPASTAKLVTGVAALTELGPDRTFDTTVRQGPGDLVVLTGGGDMMLAAGKGDPDAVNGRAGLADLADQVAAKLRLAGRDSATVALDTTLFSGPELAPGWDEADVSMGYVAPVAPLAVDVAKMSEGEYPPRYPDPALHAGRVFAQRLADAGITVTGDVTWVDASATGDVLGTVESAPVAEVAQYFLDTSDNTITEVVARMVAVELGLPGSFEGATKAVLRTASALGVDTSGAVLADASGLAEGSALPPRMLLGLLELVIDPAHPELREVGTGMPVGGLTGTLTHRFADGAATGLVRAKTGSLKNVTSLAGTVLDADGRLLLFVLMADRTGAVGQEQPRAALDGFVDGLAGCGCRG